MDMSSPKPAARRTAPTGLVEADRVRKWFVHGLHATAVLLLLLSVVGTFYGSRGLDAPVTRPLQIVSDMLDNAGLAAMAILAQGVLALFQWGARQFASSNPRWWLLYAAALLLSVWWNWQAYADPLVALGVPWLVAGGVIVLGDVFPEIVLVREK